MNIVVINGMPRSGKDLFVSLCGEYLGCRLLNVSTVDKVKSLARDCGWDGTKTPENRKFLSELKDLLTKWRDVPYNDIVQKIRQHESTLRGMFTSEELIVFVHCREPEEIKKFKDRLGAKTLLMRRNEVESLAQSNHADSEVFKYDYDYTIENNGTIEELKEKAKEFLKNFGGLDI